MPTENNYWFPAKRYGWGWGPPAAWQGWLVLLVFVVCLIAVILFVPPQVSPLQFAGSVIALSLLLVAVCWAKGEPPRWRWGDKE